MDRPLRQHRGSARSLAAAVFAVVLVLGGLGIFGATFHGRAEAEAGGGLAAIRFAYAYSASEPLEVSIDGVKQVVGLRSGSVSPFVIVDAGEREILAFGPLRLLKKVTLAPNSASTVAIVSGGGTPKLIVLDETQDASVRARLVNDTGYAFHVANANKRTKVEIDSIVTQPLGAERSFTFDAPPLPGSVPSTTVPRRGVKATARPKAAAPSIPPVMFGTFALQPSARGTQTLVVSRDGAGEFVVHAIRPQAFPKERLAAVPSALALTPKPKDETAFLRMTLAIIVIVLSTFATLATLATFRARALEERVRVRMHNESSAPLHDLAAMPSRTRPTPRDDA